jgi:hypothetical protein
MVPNLPFGGAATELKVPVPSKASITTARTLIRIIVYFLRYAGLQNKKGTGSLSRRGHDYRQPKVEEGADAFWQVRQK